MRISHHLRSDSSFSSAAVTTAAPTAAPTRSHTPLQRIVSRSTTVSLPIQVARPQRQGFKPGFRAEDIPQDWGNELKDSASSVYSMAVTSPLDSAAASILNLPRSSAADHFLGSHLEEDEITTASDERSPLNNNETRSLSSKGIKAVRDNISSSNLSNGSKSSKTSRFKEDFESLEGKKTTKRSSIVNLFTRSRGKRCSNSLGSFDGTADEYEPKRLQRALALADRQDATGLLAKAIKAQQSEKSSMYLSANKEKAPREMFRQRSSSFSEPRTPVHGAKKAGSESLIHPQSSLDAAPRDTSSEVHFKPEFSMPDLAIDNDIPMPPSEKRAQSMLGRLKPEFSHSLFKNSADSESVLIEPRIRDSVVKLDPRDVTSDRDKHNLEERAPSFQLNDIPAVIGSLPETPATSHLEWTSNVFTTPTRTEGITVALQDDTHLNLGSWSRYPSHTREKRTGSATASDLVKSRDFAYEINPASITTDSSTEDSDKGDKKKGRTKKARTGLPKSKSMMIGKEFIRNYARIIRSPSVEWLSHGKGHRSSVSAGGSLAHPELEVLPPVFAATPINRIEEEDLGLPTIPLYTAHKDTLARDPKDSIELRHIRPPKRGRRESTKAEPSRFDGSSYSDDISGTNEESGHSGSYLSLPTVTTKLASSEKDQNANALSWSDHYASCVKLSRNSGSVHHHINSSDCTDTSTFMTYANSDSNTGLIDAMLASRNPSIRHMNRSASFSDVGAAGRTFPRCMKPDHKANRSLSSVASLRASSMDLLEKLAAAEEHERKKILQLLRTGSSKSSGEMSKTTMSQSIPTQTVQLCSEDGPMTLGSSAPCTAEAN
jgi:hypothetical protein